MHRFEHAAWAIFVASIVAFVAAALLLLVSPI
jgi:hypothetical protein